MPHACLYHLAIFSCSVFCKLVSWASKESEVQAAACISNSGEAIYTGGADLPKMLPSKKAFAQCHSDGNHGIDSSLPFKIWRQLF